MGSPDFAVPSLQGLVEAGYRVTLAVTQPDRPAGRGRAIRRPAVAEAADVLGIPVYQPSTLRTPDARAPIESEQPYLIVVAAFGLLLPQAILDLPQAGCVNVHASLLPRHRGAAPIQASILDGDEQTGITIMSMDAGMDTGGIISQRSIPVTNEDAAMSLEPRLAEFGRDLLIKTIPAWIAGDVKAVPQNDELATYAPKIKRSDAEIDWTESVEVIDRQIRAYRGWPNAFTTTGRQALLILKGRPYPDVSMDGEPGTILVQRGAPWSPAVITGSGLLQLISVQPEGKRPMSGIELINGRPSLAGSLLG
jgi:methionyl-tRNA formyltransferase